MGPGTFGICCQQHTSILTLHCKLNEFNEPNELSEPIEHACPIYME